MTVKTASAIVFGWMLAPAALWSQTNPVPIKFGGQIRARQESTNILSYATPGGRHGQDQTLLRIRLWAEADAGHDIKGYLQLQDARLFGSEPNTTANTANVDLHQGYLDILNIFGQPVDARIGRMELQYGDQRLVGTLDWNNVGRAFDGARLRYRFEQAAVDAFAVNVKQTADVKRNQAFWGLYSSCKAVSRHEADLYVLGRDFGDGTQTAELGNKGNLSDRTLGARVKGTPGAWDYTGEAAWQFGRKAGQRARAWAAAATGGYTFAHAYKPRLGVEYDYASGDSNPSDNAVQTFDPLFPTGHLYQGYQDIFYWRNGHDFKGTASIVPAAGWKVQADYHKFLLDHGFDAWYDKTGAVIARDMTGGSGRNVGDEIDLHVRAKFRDTIGLWFGYSRFFPGRFVKNTVGNKDRDWAFFQATLDF